MKNTLLLLLITSQTFGQVILRTNEQANDIRNTLIECHYSQAELKLVYEALQQANVNRELTDRIIESLSSEVASLRRMGQNHNDIMEVMYTREDEYRKQLARKSNPFNIGRVFEFNIWDWIVRGAFFYLGMQVNR
jgi:dephospho-CoA kinase